jgi:hypothetical protein
MIQELFGQTVRLGHHPQKRQLGRVSKDARDRASWFETAQARLLTMRNFHHEWGPARDLRCYDGAMFN